MPFLVLPALIPDIRAVYDVYFAAFTADADGRRLLDILFPGGVTSTEFRDAHTKGTLAWWHTSDTQYTFKCLDSDTGEVVGMALCDVFVNPRGEKERAMPEVGWLQGRDKERAERVLGTLWRARERIWGGGRYIYIHAFAVHPKHQGRGAGAALVQALIDLSESTGLPIYLESSPGSQGLYKKMGFMQVPGEVARVVHEAAVLGTEKDVEVPLMIKLPASITGSSSETGKSVEEVYLDWYRRRDIGDEKANGTGETKVRRQ
ncbi:puromycin N-acetyltransferase [Achaetomium macrosporum]|uniref:Puromycin N-acetyltransferase n=1 Tax=Achaetomium macrosporum TaxID=79813 RepID=A0AAN7C360_9PEZI|nr:puromycin N-acetyltransferase [Achaetomium macrosporum]